MNALKKMIFATGVLFSLMILGSSCSNNQDTFSPEIKVEQESNQDFSNTINEYSAHLKSFAQRFNQNYLVNVRSTNEKDGQELEKEAKDALVDVHAKALEVLKSSGLEDAEIAELFGSSDSPEVIITATLITELFEKGKVDLRGEIGDCILEAFGIKGLAEAFSGRALAGYATRKALVKAVGAAAARAGLGWIGTALTVASFVDCMW